MSDAERADDVLRVRAIETRAVSLVDDSGKQRASLDCHQGIVFLQFYDGDGCPRLELQLDDNGPSIRLWNHADSPCVTLSVARHGNGITIGDSIGRPLINLGVHAGREGMAAPELSVSDPNGDTIFQLPRTRSGE